MNKRLRDLVVNAIIDRHAAPLTTLAEELVTYLEDMLVDREALARHVNLLRGMRVVGVDVEPFEIADLVLHGVRGLHPDLLARVLLSPNILEHLWEMIDAVAAEIRARNDPVSFVNTPED